MPLVKSRKIKSASRLRIAVIGAGLIGARHAALVAARRECLLVGVADTNPALRPVADALGAAFYNTTEELLERETPDGAIIATPNADHARTATLCLQRGVHILVEKPIAETLAEARRIVTAAAEHGVTALVGHHRRHSPYVQKVRELVHGGALGRLVGVSVLWALLKPDDYFRAAWRRERPGGGPLLINMIHDLDTLRFIGGEVATVLAHASHAARHFAVEDTLSVSLAFENGALGSLLASDATPAAWSYEANTAENPSLAQTEENCCHFIGTKASLAFPRMELWRYGSPSRQGWQHPLQRRRVAVRAANPLAVQLAHFCRILRGEEEPLASAAEGARTLALALAIRQAAEKGGAVYPATLLHAAGL